MTEEQMLSAAAPAKVNLYLHVTGRLDNGYHLLDSLVVFTSIGDHLEWQPGPPPFHLEIIGPFAAGLPTDGSNLVVQALNAAARLADTNAGGTARLTKRLPVASGIGGGSSDAAAMLRLAARHWGLDLTSPKLLRIAESLGADVPVCLTPVSQHMSGIGERLNSGPDLSGAPIVLANPGVAVPTPSVFKARQGPFSPSMPIDGEISWSNRSGQERLVHDLAERTNDLAAPAMRLHPKIADCVASLVAQPGCLLARMSGSGATCFGVFETAEGARQAALGMSAQHPDWWIEAGQIL